MLAARQLFVSPSALESFSPTNQLEQLNLSQLAHSTNWHRRLARHLNLFAKVPASQPFVATNYMPHD